MIRDHLHKYGANDYASYIGRTYPLKNGAVGPVTRWFRTNTFYRKPFVGGRIECMGDELAEIMPKIGENSNFPAYTILHCKVL